MNKTVLFLSIIMGAVVLTSNFLVQFPVNYYGLSEILTYGAFTYPIAFLITDLANRSFGKEVAKKINLSAQGCINIHDKAIKELSLRIDNEKIKF